MDGQGRRRKDNAAKHPGNWINSRAQYVWDQTYFCIGTWRAIIVNHSYSHSTTPALNKIKSMVINIEEKNYPDPSFNKSMKKRRSCCVRDSSGASDWTMCDRE
ncbi:hypothetical protein PV325_004499 [Microctonus aethiopoides]|nr:hypothetical protein PV325_004499 [Microctonus aethiopoides]